MEQRGEVHGMEGGAAGSIPVASCHGMLSHALAEDLHARRAGRGSPTVTSSMTRPNEYTSEAVVSLLPSKISGASQVGLVVPPRDAELLGCAASSLLRLKSAMRERVCCSMKGRTL